LGFSFLRTSMIFETYEGFAIFCLLFHDMASCGKMLGEI
jgi:hypothetical protein